MCTRIDYSMWTKPLAITWDRSVEIYNFKYLSAISTIQLRHTLHETHIHYNDVIMGALASQISSLSIVYSTVNLVADQRKHQSSPSLAFVRRIHRGPVNSPHKWPVTRKMFPFDDVIMRWLSAIRLFCTEPLISAVSDAAGGQAVHW